MKMRSGILASLYKLFPFSLKGDVRIDETEVSYDVSCVINFYGRIDLLEGILYSLASQDISRDRYELVLVEDEGGTKEGWSTAEKFGALLNIQYFALMEQHGKMGYSRNFALSKTRGRYIMFLDDDTVLLQKDFLSLLIDEFEETGAVAIVPNGLPGYCLLNGRYGFHDKHFPTNRCVAYTRNILAELGGFVSEIVGQEDVEFVVRFIASGNEFYDSERLWYLHPPLIVKGLSKSVAVGYSFARLKKRYPLLVWLMLLLNGMRHAPLLLLPLCMKWRMQGKFGFGFFLGTIYSITGKKIHYY